MLEQSGERARIAEASGDFVRVLALGRIWHTLLTNSDTPMSERAAAASIVSTDFRNLIKKCADHAKFVGELMEKYPDLLANFSEGVRTLNSESKQNSWRKLVDQRSSIEAIALNEMNRIVSGSEAMNEALLAQEQALKEGREPFTTRGFGFECGFLIGATIVLAAGGPVGVMAAVEVGGVAAFACLS